MICVFIIGNNVKSSNYVTRMDQAIGYFWLYPNSESCLRADGVLDSIFICFAQGAQFKMYQMFLATARPGIMAQCSVQLGNACSCR
jgi:hypothetical protein